MYLDAKAAVLETFTGDDPAIIQFKDDKKPRSWTYETVTVYPEGIGAAACFVLDKDGAPESTDLLTGETIVLDLGAYTLDALKLVDGNFNPESLEHATWENGGLNVHIVAAVLATVIAGGSIVVTSPFPADVIVLCLDLARDRVGV